jgi:hypothetical protein
MNPTAMKIVATEAKSGRVEAALAMFLDRVSSLSCFRARFYVRLTYRAFCLNCLQGSIVDGLREGRGVT